MIGSSLCGFLWKFLGVPHARSFGDFCSLSFLLWVFRNSRGMEISVWFRHTVIVGGLRQPYNSKQDPLYFQHSPSARSSDFGPWFLRLIDCGHRDVRRAVKRWSNPVAGLYRSP